MDVNQDRPFALQAGGKNIQHETVLAILLLIQTEFFLVPSAEIISDDSLEEIAGTLHCARARPRRVEDAGPFLGFGGRKETSSAFGGSAVRDSFKNGDAIYGYASNLSIVRFRHGLGNRRESMPDRR